MLIQNFANFRSLSPYRVFAKRTLGISNRAVTLVHDMETVVLGLTSLIPQGFNWIQPCRLVSRIDAKEDTYRC